MYTHPNSEVKMGRQNADPLVGLPSLSQRNYNAAGTRTVNISVLKFKKREMYYSMYVSGFILDTVANVEVASQGGNIPEEWVRLGGWEDTDDDPPQEFWRTLVADRGRHGRNPPTYYARACKESITKGLKSGSLNTTELINDGRCSVVAEFFRRVQAVIWNRSLMRTESGNLGIVRKDTRKDDLVCIFYGCSVPVILRQKRKTAAELVEEQKADEDDLKMAKEIAAITIQRGYRERLARRESKPPKGGEAQSTGEGKAPNLRNGTGEPTSEPNPRNETKPADNTDESKSRDPREFYYEFIGECYVHGMMDGEAIKYQNDQNIKAQVFELR
jgi:hypothetical protein